ncbi:hypothetical protein FSP39_008480 [Pinctada imbricata]|uniref:SMB domain-containing protein n=1 Tax=Pinctada imbricata TaxID=66713 RepID=A0AA88YM29_PINIB|nr:hypothetical protein FSP39_008480 [Pinctada imbricata]
MRSHPIFVLFMYIGHMLLQYQGVPLKSPSALEIYIRYCGAEKLCGNFSQNVRNESLKMIACPVCECDKTCILKGTCCPDFHLNTCIDISLYFESESKISFESVYLISKCPINATEADQKLCELTSFEDDALIDVPVKSVHTNISYKNKHCAECNNEFLLLKWGLSIEECMKKGFDMNMFSSIEGLYKGIEEYSCNFGYDWTLADTVVARCQKQYITTCNVTGLWNKYDPDIAWACENYHSPVTFFANVFCYDCNVGTSTTLPLIEACPAGTDAFLDNLCISEAEDPLWFPYKNVHCYRCGGVEISDFALHYYSFDAISTFPYELKIILRNQTDVLCHLMNTILYRYLRISNTLSILCNQEGKTNEVEELMHLEKMFDKMFGEFLRSQNSSQINIDFPSLYKTYELFGGRDKWCFNVNKHSIINKCSCKPSCFKKDECCPDMMAGAPYECVQYGNEGIELITKCPYSFSDDVIRYYCERQIDEFGSVVDHIPYIHITMTFNYQYRNIFCFLCNEDPAQMSDQSSFSYFRNITFKCPHYMNLNDTLILSQTYHFMNEHCQVELQHSNHYENDFICAIYANGTSNKWTCPVTEKPFQHKNDIVYLCENTGYFIYRGCTDYRNIFCDMCDHIEQCDDDGCPYRMSASTSSCHFNGFTKLTELRCDMCINYRHIFALAGGKMVETHAGTQSKCGVSEHRDPYTVWTF